MASRRSILEKTVGPTSGAAISAFPAVISELLMISPRRPGREAATATWQYERASHTAATLPPLHLLPGRPPPQSPLPRHVISPNWAEQGEHFVSSKWAHIPYSRWAGLGLGGDYSLGGSLKWLNEYFNRNNDFIFRE